MCWYRGCTSTVIELFMVTLFKVICFTNGAIITSSYSAAISPITTTSHSSVNNSMTLTSSSLPLQNTSTQIPITSPIMFTTNSTLLNSSSANLSSTTLLINASTSSSYTTILLSTPTQLTQSSFSDSHLSVSALDTSTSSSYTILSNNTVSSTNYALLLSSVTDTSLLQSISPSTSSMSRSSDIFPSSTITTFSSFTPSSTPPSLTPTSVSTFINTLSIPTIANQNTNSAFKQTVLPASSMSTTLLNPSATVSITLTISPSPSSNSTNSSSTNFTNNSTYITSIHFPTNSLTNSSTNSSLASIAFPPTPNPAMAQAPTLPAGVTLPRATPSPCGSSSCCTYGLNQLPVLHIFDESTQPGSKLVAMRDVYNVTFTVQIRHPQELIPLLDGYFNITQSGQDHILTLQKKVDLEGLYKQAGEKMDVHELQLQIVCVDQLFPNFIVPPRLLNITIDDTDDNMPVFLHSNGGSPGCEVPVYKAETSEDFMGVLNVNPNQIQAVDGDLLTQHNISYHVMHSEPDDYHVFFNVHQESGSVNKTKAMNSSDPSKYVIFIQAVEDSPQQKSRVAILSIVVVAPDPPGFTSSVNPVARLSVQIACVFVLMLFICGMVVVIHHRYRRSQKQVHATDYHSDDARDVRLPQLAVYTSSNSSLNSAVPDIPVINSPSQVTLDDSPKKQWLELPSRESESQRMRRIIVKKPLDTTARPSWNAPAPRPKRTTYNPFTPYKNARISGK